MEGLGLALVTPPTGPIRVALLSPCYWPEVRRGTERFTRDLADGLIERGHRPRLITSHPKPGSTTVEDGLPVRRNRRPPERWLGRLGFEDHLTHWPLGYGSLRRGGHDIAHALHHSDALAAARWSRATGRPSVFSFMGIPREEGFGHRRLLGRVMRGAVEGTDAVVVLSRAASERMQQLLGVEARVIPPGVDTEAFTPGGGRSEQPTIFCGADPAEPRKRVALLVEAFALVRERQPDARLVLSRRPGVDGPRGAGIEWRDLDRRAALVAANREAWVHTLPSFGEAFGLVLAEALACGTTVVGPTRALVDGVGEHFAADDPPALAAALERALDRARDPATPAACRVRGERFSRRATTDAYAALYAELGA